VTAISRQPRRQAGVSLQYFLAYRGGRGVIFLGALMHGLAHAR
jgi:hypothetical protein